LNCGRFDILVYALLARSGARYINGRLSRVTPYFTNKLTRNISHTIDQGEVKPNAPTEKMILSIGTLTLLLASTLAH
jgi:hypothetical protein